MFSKKISRDKAINFVFSLLLIGGIGLIFQASRIEANTPDGCFPSLFCRGFQNDCDYDLSREPFCSNTCTGCQPPPCRCYTREGKCTKPDSVPGPPQFAYCFQYFCQTAFVCNPNGPLACCDSCFGMGGECIENGQTCECFGTPIVIDILNQIARAWDTQAALYSCCF